MSNTDKRSVATDALETLGTIIGNKEARDAIHLAVEPVTAAEVLDPGEHIGMVDGKAAACDKPLGIVDPFLTRSVEPGERFWLVVYPRQIRSLRHVWEHPAFPSAVPAASDDPVEKSRKWIRDFAEKVGLCSSTLMDGAHEWIRSQEEGKYPQYMCLGGFLEDKYVPDEFWEHYERVEGVVVSEKLRGSFFTCSC